MDPHRTRKSCEGTGVVLNECGSERTGAQSSPEACGACSVSLLGPGSGDGVGRSGRREGEGQVIP